MVRNKLYWDANNAVGLSEQTNYYYCATFQFLLKVPLRYLLPSIIYSVPCNRIVQRASLLTRFLSTQVLAFEQLQLQEHMKVLPWRCSGEKSSIPSYTKSKI